MGLLNSIPTEFSSRFSILEGQKQRKLFCEMLLYNLDNQYSLLSNVAAMEVYLGE